MNTETAGIAENMRAVRIHRTGGPDVLEVVEAPVPTLGQGEILVSVEYAGINYIDTYYREGIYHSPLPTTLGIEGTGRVVHDPQGIMARGTRVAWFDGHGSYAEYDRVHRDRLVTIPESVDGAVAASMLLQGVTAHFLVDGVFPLEQGTICLITAGAGGVGLLATQLAAARGARVLSVVSTPEKRALALDAGAEEVFYYGDSLSESVRNYLGGRGVDVAYDGVGRTTFEHSLNVVNPCGVVCLFGAASGPVPPIDPQELSAHGSLFLTRPNVWSWTSRPGEFDYRAHAVVDAVCEGALNVRVSAQYSLEDAQHAHADLQARRTTGSLVLKIHSSQEQN